MSSELSFKFILIGDSGVGKSSLIQRYVDNTFPENFTATIGIDYKIKKFKKKGFDIKIQIIDTAGQERFLSLTNTFFKNSDGIFLVFDLIERKSFENLKFWMEKIEAAIPTEEELNIIILGNKNDLKDKVITKDEVMKTYNYEYFETSAKKGNNVMKAFEKMVDLIIKDKNKEELLMKFCKNYNKKKVLKEEEKNPHKRTSNAKCC